MTLESENELERYEGGEKVKLPKNFALELIDKIQEDAENTEKINEIENILSIYSQRSHEDLLQMIESVVYDADPYKKTVDTEPEPIHKEPFDQEYKGQWNPPTEKSSNQSYESSEEEAHEADASLVRIIINRVDPESLTVSDVIDILENSEDLTDKEQADIKNYLYQYARDAEVSEIDESEAMDWSMVRDDVLTFIENYRPVLTTEQSEERESSLEEYIKVMLKRRLKNEINS